MKAKVSDLVILIRRLCHALPSNHSTRALALDYLNRTGNNPSRLRHGEMASFDDAMADAVPKAEARIQRPLSRSPRLTRVLSQYGAREAINCSSGYDNTFLIEIDDSKPINPNALADEISQLVGSGFRVEYRGTDGDTDYAFELSKFKEE